MPLPPRGLDDRGVVTIGIPGGVILVGGRGRRDLSGVPRMNGAEASFAVRMQLHHAYTLGAGDAALFDRLRALARDECLAVRSSPGSNLDVAEAIERGLASGLLIAVRLARVAPERPDAGDKADADHLPAGTVDRIKKLLLAAPRYMRKELAEEFAKLFTIEALAGVAAAFAVLLAAQFVGLGEIADAALAWWAYTQAGISGLYGLYQALRAVVAAVNAKDDAAFDRAARDFATGLDAVGIALLTVVVTRAARRTKATSDAPAETPAQEPAPPKRTAPPRTRLPRTNGHWDGVPGESNWHSDNPAVNAVTDGQPIPFKNGRPDFSQWSQGDIQFEHGTLDGSPNDFNEVYKYIQNEKGLSSPTAAKQLLSDLGLTPHHLDADTIQLIPTDLHGNIPHIGSASDLRGSP